MLPGAAVCLQKWPACFVVHSSFACWHSLAWRCHDWNSLSSTVGCDGLVRSRTAVVEGTRHLVTTGVSQHCSITTWYFSSSQFKNPWWLSGSAMICAAVGLRREFACSAVHSSLALVVTTELCCFTVGIRLVPSQYTTTLFGVAWQFL